MSSRVAILGGVAAVLSTCADAIVTSEVMMPNGYMGGVYVSADPSNAFQKQNTPGCCFTRDRFDNGIWDKCPGRGFYGGWWGSNGRGDWYFAEILVSRAEDKHNSSDTGISSKAPDCTDAQRKQALRRLEDAERCYWIVTGIIMGVFFLLIGGLLLWCCCQSSRMRRDQEELYANSRYGGATEDSGDDAELGGASSAPKTQAGLPATVYRQANGQQLVVVHAAPPQPPTVRPAPPVTTPVTQAATQATTAAGTAATTTTGSQSTAPAPAE